VAATGTAFLAARKQARDRAIDDALHAAAAAEKAFAALSKVARASHRREAPEGATTPPLIDAAFLVKTASTARFHAAVRRQSASGRRAGIDLVLTGPWPAYNFVQQSGVS
jgi:Gas vesicle synthesis protein GvpL/GvpF